VTISLRSVQSTTCRSRMLHRRTLESSDPLMKYPSSTGLKWMQVTEHIYIYSRNAITRAIGKIIEANRAYHFGSRILITVIAVREGLEAHLALRVPQPHCLVHRR
jgi:hypothetical protein